MLTIHDAGVPRDADLPSLDVGQIDRLVDHLIGSPTAALASAEALVLPAAETPPRTRWRRPIGLAAAVAGLVAVTAAVVGDRSTPSNADLGDPTPVVQLPAPDFGCWVDGLASPTEVAAYLPWTTPLGAVKVGLTEDTACFEFPTGGGVGAQLGSSREMVPVFSGSVDETADIAFGVIDPAVSRVEFVPDDPALPVRLVETFTAVGRLNAFSLTYTEDGSVRFFAGTRLVAEKPVEFTPFARTVHPEITATGRPCDPTVAYTRANAASFTLAGPDATDVLGQVYLEALDPDHPAPASERPLCLLIVSSPQVSVATTSDDVTAPLPYLASTKGVGGTYLWGSLSGRATNLMLTDTAGTTEPLAAADRDDTRSGWVPFIVFVPDGAPAITTVQPVDRAGSPVGAPRSVG